MRSIASGALEASPTAAVPSIEASSACSRSRMIGESSTMKTLKGGMAEALHMAAVCAPAAPRAIGRA